MATNYPTGITTQATVVWGGDGSQAVDIPVTPVGTALMDAASATAARAVISAETAGAAAAAQAAAISTAAGDATTKANAAQAAAIAASDPVGAAAAAQAAAASDATTKANAARDAAILATTGILRATFNGNGAVPSAGSKGFLEVPYDCTVNKATMLADQSGSAIIDIKRSTYAAFPTTASICAAALPTLAGAQKAQDSTLTGWTVALSKGDILEFDLNSASVLNWIQVSLEITRR